MNIGKRVSKFVWGLMLACTVVGCGKAVNKSELPGKYMADFGFATDTFSIIGDGHFAQTVKVKSDGRVVTTNGTWRFNQENHKLIFNENFMLAIDGFSDPISNFDSQKKKGIVLMAARRRFGKIEIGGDDFFMGPHQR